MFKTDKMLTEMTDLEKEFLWPSDFKTLEGYYFAMESVNENGNWLGYVVLPDDREIAVAYNASKGVTKYRKDDAYYDFVQDAREIFPLDSCAIDTMSALLVLAEANEWDDVDD